ncbi:MULTISPECIES: APC family permease [Cryobacterium]|uniref:Amino acid permease n=1 Tax=Cryobacterium breve TaxID=1259258 RepID=A0ABY2J1T6_9MICO|nr:MULTISPECIES: APC family permease [Cryobacterium]TFC91787.1 amino acid permease [Cryobacterium sp. TmT3-12]TFC98337.1 amino acid permease [Cryobacterium breve]
MNLNDDTDSKRGAALAPSGELKRNITGRMLFLFILGDVLGAGIYALVGQIAGKVGGVTWVPMLLALALALLTAASYAELVTKYPHAGGSAVFAERAYKRPIISFLVGFCMLAAGVVSAAGLALAFAGDYLRTFIDIDPVFGAVIFLAVIGAVNARGIKESVRANLVMTMIETTGLVLVVAAVGVLLSNGGGDIGRAVRFEEGSSPVVAIFGAALLAYYSFVGFETSANVIEEVTDPSRVYPKALFAALTTAGVLYVLVGTAASVAVPADELAGSTGPLLTVIQATAVAIPDWLFSVIALVAVANGALLTMIMSSRLTYGMSTRRLLPSVLSRVLPGRGTPWLAIVSTTLLAMVLTVTGSIATLAETVVLLLLIVFLSTNIAVLVLRRERVQHHHFRAWTVLPALGALSCLVLLTQLSGEVWLRGGIMIAVGAVIYFIQVLVRRSQVRS